jgi:hypothetical protein
MVGEGGVGREVDLGILASPKKKGSLKSIRSPENLNSVWSRKLSELFLADTNA